MKGFLEELGGYLKFLLIAIIMVSPVYLVVRLVLWLAERIHG